MNLQLFNGSTYPYGMPLVTKRFISKYEEELKYSY